MLTANTRELFLLQSKSNLKSIEKNVNAAQAKTQATTVSSQSMVYIDADAEKTHMLDPCIAFNIPAHIAAKQTQLHLGNKGINAIHPNTMLFVSLETIILADNRLRKLTGLLPSVPPNVTTAPSGCSRLKQLILTNNKLASLSGDIEDLKYLEVLLLGNNLLSNMERVSKQLQHLHYLTQLDLSKNPVCEEQSYRLYFIHKHPSLEQLDRRTITAEERAEAAAMFGRGHGGGKGRLHGGGMSSSSSVVSSMFPSINPKSTASGASESGVAGRSGNNNASDKPKTAVAFGGTYTKHSDAGHTASSSGAEGMSASAALLESKVRAILLKRQADKVREESKAQTELDEIVERREMFHTLWKWSGEFLKENAGQASGADAAGGDAAAASAVPAKGKGGKGAAAAAAASASPVAPTSGAQERPIHVPAQLRAASVVTLHPHQSSLFTEGCSAKFPALDPLLDRVRQLLRAEPERKAAVAEDLRKMLHQVIPERPGDGYNAAYSSWQQERLPDTVQQYLRRTAASLIMSSEVAALVQLFGSMEAMTVDVESWGAVAKALEGGEGLQVPRLQAAYRAEYKLPSPVSAGAARRGSLRPAKTNTVSATHAVNVEQAMQLLVRYLPFAAARPEIFQQKSALALKEGQSELAKKYFQLMNEATEHHRFLLRCVPSGVDEAVTFVLVNTMPR